MLRSCGVCCFGFSLFAIVFLLVVSAILNSGSDIIAIDEAIRYDAAANCQYAAGVYGVFVMVSCLCYVCGRYSDNRSLRVAEEKLRLLKSKNQHIYQQV